MLVKLEIHPLWVSAPALPDISSEVTCPCSPGNILSVRHGAQHVGRAMAGPTAQCPVAGSLEERHGLDAEHGQWVSKERVLNESRLSHSNYFKSTLNNILYGDLFSYSETKGKPGSDRHSVQGSGYLSREKADVTRK